MKNKYIITTLILALFAMIWGSPIQGQVREETQPATDLFEAVANPNLNTEQQDYFNALSENQLRFFEGGFAKVNPENLVKGNSIMLNLPGEKRVNLTPSKVQYRNDGRVVWKSKSETEMLTAYFIINEGKVTGSVTQGENMYNIYPLSNGLHYIQGLGDIETEGCGMTVPGNNEKSETHKHHDHNHDHGNKFEDDETGAENYNGGECKVRLLVAYTNATDAASADILSRILLYIEQYNDANANSNVGHELELARAVEVFYTETNTGSTHPDHSNWTNTPDDLLRFQNPSDGFMDNVHGLRNLYDADMCMLMTVNLSGWGGYAYDYAPPASKSFCAMVWNNGIPQTFAHELGHLLGMHHDTFVDSSSGYYHGYIDITGPTTFRTIMSYSNGCGGTACPVIDYWSNPYVNYLGNVTGTTTTANNARVSRENDHIIAGYQSTIYNKSVFQNDNIRIRESGNIFADNTITTAGRTVNYFNGSTGQYVADQSITFTPGFRAYSGSEFRAFLDHCSAVNFDEGEPEITLGNTNDTEISEDELVTETASGFSDLTISPNPAFGITKIQYNLVADADTEIRLTSPEGKQISTLLPQTFQSKGANELTFDVSDLAPGMYYVSLIFGKEKETRKIVVAR